LPEFLHKQLHSLVGTTVHVTMKEYNGASVYFANYYKDINQY